MVVMGRVTAPYGVRGWIKIQPFTETPGNLLGYKPWWITGLKGWEKIEIDQARLHGKFIIAKPAGCHDRDAAFVLKGREIAVPRESLPGTEAHEYYWTDLIGLHVRNLQQFDFGKVVNVFETGANDVLVVQGERERLIPFVDQVIKEVDLATGKILVDWDADF
ncbi:MAG: ribosome maturation factor RimM [Methylophilaceae bacterium]|nr:ribosome maturation factor RimM [Methylophilaceae bacterium]